jgi:hypothetical protein
MSSSTTDKLSGVRAKIEQAKQHAVDLGVALRDFFSANPYQVGTRRDPETRKLTYYVVSVKDAATAVPLLAKREKGTS